MHMIISMVSYFTKARRSGIVEMILTIFALYIVGLIDIHPKNTLCMPQCIKWFRANVIPQIFFSFLMHAKLTARFTVCRKSCIDLSPQFGSSLSRNRRPENSQYIGANQDIQTLRFNVLVQALFRESRRFETGSSHLEQHVLPLGHCLPSSRKSCLYDEVWSLSLNILFFSWW